MRKIFAALVLASLFATAVPMASATETITLDYTGTFGVGSVIAGWLRPCAVDFETCNGLGVDPKFGGGQLIASTIYPSVQVSAVDDLFAGDTGVSACFMNPDGVTGNLCDGEDFASAELCGGVVLVGSPFPSDTASVWVYTAIVQDDLTTCFGSSGLVAGTFF